MAGSKVPGGSLKSHASMAEKATKKNLFSAAKPAGPKVKPGTFTGDGSDSSSSESDSDSSASDSDDDTKTETAVDFQKRLSQTPLSKSKASSAKNNNVAELAKAATPGKSPTINGLSARSKKAAKKEDTPTSSESTSDSESEDEKAAVSQSKANTKSDTSSDSESASTSESNEASRTKSKPALKTQAKTKAKVAVKKDSTTTSDAETSSADSESDSESESESEDGSEAAESSVDAAQQIEEQIENDVKTARSKSSKPQSKSTSEEPSKKKAKHSDAVPRDEDGDVEMVDQSLALTNGGHATNVGDVPEFVAPDFHLRKLDGNVDAADVAGFFAKAKLEGKQVWYITAPASLPVTVVQDLTIPMDQAQKGLPVLSHNGDDYRMAFDDPAASSSFRLLIPNKKGDVYSLLDQPINQTMHFTRSETFPPGGPASVTTTQTISTAKTKAPRPQPEGLRARYTPLGVPSPKPTITASTPAKNKAVGKVAEQDKPGASPSKASPSKKKRKHRDDGEDGSTANISTPVQKKLSQASKFEIPAEKSAKKQKTANEEARKVTPIPPPQLGRGTGPRSSEPVPASSRPAKRSRASRSPGADLPATQPSTVKQTPIPVPVLPSWSAAGPEETADDRKKAEKAAKKAKKAEEKAAKKAAS